MSIVLSALVFSWPDATPVFRGLSWAVADGRTGLVGPNGEGRGVTALAEPGGTLLMLAFQPGPLRALVEGVSQAEVEAAFPGWELLSVERADTAGLGWPMSTTAPQWYRLGRG